jgi:hypothetical protein
MEEKSNTTKSVRKSARQKCKEDIKYIQRKINHRFKFVFLPYDIFPNADCRYYGQLHGLLNSYISTCKLRDLEGILMFYINNEVQKPDIIRIIGKYCNLKTLGIEEQFAISRLLSEDNIRTLLELSMEDCDTFTHQALLELFSCDDLEKFKEQAGSIKYSASKISRVAQAICVHSFRVSDYLYDHTLNSILDRIASYNEDFANRELLMITPNDSYCDAHTLGILPMLLDKHYEPVTTYINSHVLDYGTFRDIKLSRIPMPFTNEEFLSRMMWFRIKMLEQYISNKVDELKDKRQEERPHVTTPASHTAKSASLTDKPTTITNIEGIDAFCKAFASNCYPNDPDVVKSFFWNTPVDTYPEHIVWKATKKLFAAFLHYAYKERDLPKGTEILVKDIFVWRNKPLDIAGYGKDKYSDCYTQVETQICLSREGLLE